MRVDGRKNDELRQVSITRNFTKYAPGSVLVKFGDTKVLCTAFPEEKVPQFLRGTQEGWITAEYSMLPSSTQTRKPRDISRLKLDSRSAEIQRLIGRSLRSVTDLKMLGERTVWIDCDVLQADAGTRVASITGAYIALCDAVNDLIKKGILKENPVTDSVAAVSVGIVDGEMLTDLCYEEDSRAQVDMNVVMTGSGDIIELQLTGEKQPLKRKELDALLEMSKNAITEIIKVQLEAFRD